jgi:leukotriene-A4 hydrolase
MTSCTEKLPERPAFHDPHSYANAGQVRVRHLNLDLGVLFDQRTVKGTAVLTIDRFDPNARQLILDSQGLQIDETEVSAEASKYREARFTMGKRDAILGAPLAIDIAQDTKYVRIRYSSSPTASAL